MGEMVKTCRECGGENMDFKMFCGFCGATLQDRSHESGSEPEAIFPKDNTSSAPRSDPFSYSLGGSIIIGIIVFLTPLTLSLLTIPFLWQLIEAEMASFALIYGIALLVIIELIFCVGMVVQSGEWRIGNIDGAVRALLVLMLFLSIAPFLIVCLTISIGNFPTEFAWLIAFVILTSIVWLFYFGWLRGIGYEWEKDDLKT